MKRRRLAGGFRPLGHASLDLPARQARALRLSHGWLRIAGEGIARRVRAERIERGVLELVVDDPRWGRELSHLLTRLAGGLASSCPDLGIRRLRVRVEGEPGMPPAQALPAGPAVWRPAPEPDRVKAAGETEGAERSEVDEPATERLGRLASRYLERSERGRSR